MNRYVKIAGHQNWFLVLEPNTIEPEGLSEKNKEILINTVIQTIHDPKPDLRGDFHKRLEYAAIHDIDYEKIAKKSGTLLIRPSGSYTLLYGSEIIAEAYNTHFPIDEYGEIVICENDNTAEYKWVKYLTNRFPDKKIVTINFFNLKSDIEVAEYFKHAKYITFSTSFTSLEWFEKLSDNANYNHKIVGYCHDKDKWNEALEINKNVEIIETI